jgi:hypothetical protein
MERSSPTPATALAFAAHARPGAAGASQHEADSLSASSAGLAASGGVSERQEQSEEQPALEDVLDAQEDEAGAPGGGAALTGGKRKRVVLSIHEKQQVLHRLEAGEPPAAIARAFGISRQQVSDIKKNRARILAFCVDAKHLSSLQRKTLRATSEFHPGVEQELYRWIVRQRCLQRAITGDALAAKAAALFQQYAAASGAGDPTHASLKNVGVWLRHFKRAHGIKALSDDEIQQLPDTFSPAMDMALTTWPGPDQGGMYTAGAASLGPNMAASTAASGQVHNALAFGLAHSTAALNIDDVSTFMAASAGVYHPLPQHAAATLSATELLARPGASSRGEGAAPGLLGVAEAVQHLNAQVGVFERTMALKLDYLDARVEKLCFAVLPARFT